MTKKKTTLSICSLSSGSSGNCYLIKSENTTLMLDAGITGKRWMEGCQKTGTDPYTIDALLITHEHHDHIRGLTVIHNKIKDVPIYASSGTIGALAEKFGREIYNRGLRPISPGDGQFLIGDIKVQAVSLYHDAAEPLGFTFERKGKKIAIITDTGKIDDGVLKALSGCDILAIEANYEERMIMVNKKYPYQLKSRIMGPFGHLSNEDCFNVVLEVLKKRRKPEPLMILLAHLSKENNTPDNARITMDYLLKESSMIKGLNYDLDVLRRDEIGKTYRLYED